MRHTRFELGFPRHRKVSRLSDAAYRLWSSAIDHAREQRTDGFIEPADLAIIPRGGGQVGWKMSVAKELVTNGNWDEVEGGWQIHGFLTWQDSRAEVDRAREKARERMNVVRGNKSRSSEDVRANSEGTSNEVRSGTSDSPSDSDLSEEAIKSAKPNRKTRAGSWRRFPADYEPTDQHRQIAAERGVDLPLELAKIRDWEFSKPRTDPAATLRNWLREARPTLPPRKALPPGKSPADIAAEKARREAAFDAQRRAELAEEAAKLAKQNLPNLDGAATIRDLPGSPFRG